MRKLQILAIALLFAITGINFTLEAKCPNNKHFATRTTCKKGLCRTTSKCEWNKGYPKKATIKTSGTDSDTLSDTVLDNAIDDDNASDTTTNNNSHIVHFIAQSDIPVNSQIPSPEQVMVGTNSNTYAPQSFTPSETFDGAGLVGNYFSGSKIATIHDPSGENSQNYTFENVMAISQTIRPQGVLIGSFKTPGWQPSKFSCSGCKGPTTRLYGTLSQQDTDDAITEADSDEESPLSDDQAQDLLILAASTPTDEQG